MSFDDTHSLPVIDLGLCPYDQALARQLSAVEAVVMDSTQEVIFVVEHPPCLTLGRNATEQFIPNRQIVLDAGVDICETDRGGQVTAHMPGQLVVYPILHLGQRRISVRRYVDLLEDTVIATLAEYGIRATRDKQYPGVWVGDAKICALGVRITRRVSMHGLALNVTNDLGLFQKIVPCGIVDRAVTSMQQLLQRPLSLPSVRGNLTDNLQKLLRLNKNSP